VTARCEHTQLPLGECAERCCRPDLKQYQPVPEVWMRVTEAAPARPLIPTKADVASGNVDALFHMVGGSTKRPDVLDMVRELCDPTSHSERYTRAGDQPAPPTRRKKGRKQKAGRKFQPRYHVTEVPPLLVQLDESVEKSGSAEAGTSRPASSRPAGRLVAIDTAYRIEVDASRWLRVLGQDDVAVDAIQLVRRLASLLPSLERCHRRHPMRDEQRRVICCTAHRVEADIGRWWTWSRVVTGWDLPAWEPDNTCPLCGTRGSIRVRLVEKLATCTNDACRETWDDTTIGLLADHIRHENHEDEEAS